MPDKRLQLNLNAIFSSCPLIPVAIVYIFGVISGKFFVFHLFILIFILMGYAFSFFIKNTVFRNMLFYFMVFIIGNLFINYAGQYNVGPKAPSIRENLRRTIYYNVPEGEERNLLAGLFLGERQKVSKELLDIMQNTNTIHILAISGDHIGFIGIIFMGLLRLLMVPRKLSVFIAFLGVFAYVWMLGWQAPTFRAVIMFGVFAFSWILDRPSNMINTLAFAALVILIVNPQSLFQIGFQLSFVIVLGLIIFPPKPEYGYITKLLWGSGVAWLVSFPLIAHYFQVVSFVSIFANIIMVTGISIVLAIGFMSIIAGNIVIALSGVFNAVNYFIIKFLICFLKYVADIPFGYFYVENFSLLLVFLSYTSICILFLSLSHKRDFMIK